MPTIMPFRNVSFLTVLLMVMLVRAIPCSGESGYLTYSLPALAEVTEGTIEFWVQPQVDLESRLPSSSHYKGLLNIMTLLAPRGRVELRWYTGANYAPSAGLSVRVASEQGESSVLMAGEWTPAVGEWQHIAITWEHEAVAVFVNGELVRESWVGAPLPELLGDLGKARLLIGDYLRRRGEMAIDDLRISSIVRSPEELGFHGELVADEATLLLDNFESLPAGSDRHGIGLTQLPGMYGQALSLVGKPAPPK